MATRVCPGCEERLTRSARFCSNCGYQFAERTEHVARRAVVASAVVYVGILALLFSSSWWLPEPTSTNSSHFFGSVFQTLGILACGALALPLLGKGATAASLGGSCALGDLGLGLLVGLAGFAVSWLYSQVFVAWLHSGGGSELSAPAFAPSLAVLVVTTVILPAFSEEWTDRGVLWVAMRRATSPRATIFCTALLFAFMHGLNGWGPFEVPHRFLVGLGLGWVRYRSGSLWPGIAGHALLNSLALVAG